MSADDQAAAIRDWHRAVCDAVPPDPRRAVIRESAIAAVYPSIRRNAVARIRGEAALHRAAA